MSLRFKSPEEPLPPFTLSPSPPASSPESLPLILDITNNAGTIKAVDPSDDNAKNAKAKSPTSPQVSLLPASELHVFGLTPLGPEIGTVACAKCRKPVLKSAILNHLANCKKIRENGPVKPLASQSTTAAPGSSLSQGAASTAGGDDSKNGKKRKASEMEGGEMPTAAKKRAKPTPRVTKGRVKGPVDVDRQCGVINDKGLPCSRALTCKSHAMGAKRAVEGRSKPYDELLLEWNRAHKPNFVEPVKRQSKEEKKLLKEKEKKEKAALKAKEKEEAVKAALANGEKVPKKYSKSGTAGGASGSFGSSGAGGTSTHGGGGHGGGGSAKKKGKVEFSIDPNLEEERVTMDDMEQQIEVDRLVSAVRTIRQSGYGGIPLATPNDARLYFLKRREVIVSSRDLLTQALQGWSVKA